MSRTLDEIRAALAAADLADVIDAAEAPAIADSAEAKIDETERERILQAAAGGKLDTLQERLAWLLNHRPRTRDSDLALQIAYWEEFEPDVGGEQYVRKEDLYGLTRYNSVARARAKIQNTYKLFQASGCSPPAREAL